MLSIKQFFTPFFDILNSPLFELGAIPITYFSFFKFFGILFLALWISRFLLKALSHFAIHKKGIDRALVYRISRLIYYVTLGAGLLLAFSTIGFDFSNFVLLAGALGVGLGFGLQSIFNNFISGIILLFESHFRIGDTIEMPPNVLGEIREINFRTTVVLNHDGLPIIIPNSELISNKVTNLSLKHAYRKLQVAFSVALDSDPRQVIALITKGAHTLPYTLIQDGFHSPIVALKHLGDYSQEYELTTWINEGGVHNLLIHSEYLSMIFECLKEHQISFPYLPNNFLGSSSSSQKHLDK